MSELIRLPTEGDLVAGKYRLLDEIGRGGFGVVFQAKQEGINRDVAVKMLLPHAMSHDGVVERFKREAHLAGSLSHPNTVKIFDTGIYTPGENIKALPYIAMEYLEGETLQGYLFRHRRLRLEDAMDILLQMLASLGEAHAKGVVHRDLKPENIFLCNRNVEERLVKVLDFGIAKAIDGDWDNETRERLTRTGMVAGTAEYMAPEQASGETDITPALDVYAVGCLAFQMLVGKVPFEGKSPMDVAIKHISDPIPRMPPPFEGQFIERAIRKAMGKKPGQRFADAREFAETLRSGVMPEEEYYEEHGHTDEQRTVPLNVADYTDEGPTRVQGMQAMDFESSDTSIWSADNPDTIDLDEMFEQRQESQRPRKSVLLLGALAMIFLVVFGAGAGIIGYNLFFAEDKAETTEKGDTPDTVDKTTAEVTPPTKNDAKADDKAAKKADEPPVEPDKAPEEVAFASAVEITSKPSKAEVWRGDTKLGRTPLTVEREEGQTSTDIRLRTRRASASYTIDWSAVEEGKPIKVTLKGRRNGGAAKASNPVAEKAPAKSPDKGTNKGNNNAGKGDSKGGGVLFKPKTPQLDPKKN